MEYRKTLSILSRTITLKDLNELDTALNPNLGVGSNFKPCCWFSPNNSKTVKFVTVAFCSIQQYFIRNIRTKFGIPNLPQSPDIRKNSDGSISDFRFLINPL